MLLLLTMKKLGCLILLHVPTHFAYVPLLCVCYLELLIIFIFVKNKKCKRKMELGKNSL